MRTLRRRDGEVSTIDDALGEMRIGRPAIVIIEGSHGYGKSALMQAALERDHGDAMTLRARCHPAERGFSLGVVGQLLDRLPATDNPPGTERDLLHGHYRAVRELAAARPVIVAIDDIHDADPLSIQWCSYLSRRMDALPVALLLAVSPDHGAASDLITELSALPYCRIIRIGPLPPDEIGELITGIAGLELAPAFAERCHELTGGNPRVITALARRLAAIGPSAVADFDTALAAGAATVADVVMEWLRRDDAAAADLVDQFAVCPTGTLEGAALLTGRGGEAAAAARSSLRRYGLLAAGPPDRFAHPAIRQAILRRLPPSALTTLHVRAAAMLSRVGAPVAVAAEHLMLADAVGEPWSHSVLRQAAREAAATGAWQDASRYLRRVLLELSDPAQTFSVTTELGEVEYHHDVASCVRQLSTAADLTGSEPGQLAAIATFAKPCLTLESGAAAGIMSKAARGLSAAPAEHRIALLSVAAQALLSGRPDGIRPAVRGLHAEGAEARQMMSALALRAGGQGRHRKRCTALALRAVGADRTGESARYPSSDACAALALVWAEELAVAADVCSSAIAAARGLRSATEEAFALIVRAELAYRRGRLTSSLASTQQAVRMFETVGATSLRSAAYASMMRVFLVRGEKEKLSGLPASPEQPATAHMFIVGIEHEARGMIAAAHSRHQVALRHYLECGRYMIAAGLENPACSAWRSRAVVTLALLGRTREAKILADTEVSMARGWGAPGTLSRALAAMSMAYGGQTSLRLLSEAVQIVEDSEARLDLARAQTWLGRAHRDAGNDTAAREYARRGLDLAMRCEAGSLAVVAQETLRSAGGRPLDGAGQVLLTAAERRVADLVALGSSNQDVATRLSISKRTVDTHLGRIYRKLGIAGRTGLREALAMPGRSTDLAILPLPQPDGFATISGLASRRTYRG